ncbi:hypothetical protein YASMINEVIRUS_1497 [Yasminevirus sp. GU-2018]|uniref:Uncharacterized protein n=1 Tax=Yasminevirus sp. GU-2018 TaxID=2420051 RepID=A0A5K0UB72_9VIRU|nr:hypothetical protein YASMINEVIRUS_1497 [Yasminevirus sp. GU-2018]
MNRRTVQTDNDAKNSQNVPLIRVDSTTTVKATVKPTGVGIVPFSDEHDDDSETDTAQLVPPSTTQPVTVPSSTSRLPTEGLIPLRNDRISNALVSASVQVNQTNPLPDFSNDFDPINYSNQPDDENGVPLGITVTELDKLREEVATMKHDIEVQETKLLEEMNTSIDKDTKRIESLEKNEHIPDSDKADLIAAFNSSIASAKKNYHDKMDMLKKELAKKQKELEVEETTGRGKNWDSGNITTLNTWIKECNKQQFIYEAVLEKIMDKSKTIKVIMLVLCAVQSLITVSNLGISENANPYLIWTIKILLSVISALTYILTQVMTLEKFEDVIKRYTLYTDSLDNFLSTMVSTADVKVELRPDGDKFILENKDTYAKIYRESPYIKQSYWKEGIADYNEYLESTEMGNNYHARKRRVYDKFAVMNSECAQNTGLSTAQSTAQNTAQNTARSTLQDKDRTHTATSLTTAIQMGQIPRVNLKQITTKS